MEEVSDDALQKAALKLAQAIYASQWHWDGLPRDYYPHHLTVGNYRCDSYFPGEGRLNAYPRELNIRICPSWHPALNVLHDVLDQAGVEHVFMPAERELWERDEVKHCVINSTQPAILEKLELALGKIPEARQEAKWNEAARIATDNILLIFRSPISKAVLSTFQQELATLNAVTPDVISEIKLRVSPRLKHRFGIPCETPAADGQKKSSDPRIDRAVDDIMEFITRKIEEDKQRVAVCPQKEPDAGRVEGFCEKLAATLQTRVEEQSRKLELKYGANRCQEELRLLKDRQQRLSTRGRSR